MALSDIYTVAEFDYDAAIEGQLCAVVSSESTTNSASESNLGENTNEERNEGETVTIHGTGIVKSEDSRLSIYVEGVKYQFNTRGEAANKKAKDNNYYLMMAIAKNDGIDAGSIGSTTNAYTRSYDSTTGEITYEKIDDPGTYQQSIDSLNARDQFAVHALREILRIVPDPSAVSKNEITHYCEAAYQWASFMMAESSKTRAVFEDAETQEGTPEAKVDVLENNTEKLLNNIAAALERTDEKNGTSSPAHWSKTGYQDVLGAHDTATARSLPREEGEPPYESVEQAETDGWTWYQTSTASYSERVSIPKLIDWLNNYAKHTPTGESDTKQYVGLEDLINAIKGISGGGGGGSAMKSEVLYAYRNVAEAEADGWAYNNEATKWYKTGYNDVVGAHTDEIAQKLPTYRYVQKQSLVEMTKLTESIDKLTAQVKRIADSMTSNNS